MKKLLFIFCITSLCIQTVSAKLAPAHEALIKLDYNHAGVLPVFCMKYNGLWQQYVLLGREAAGGDKGLYGPWFGGKHDFEMCWQTAARECVEELLLPMSADEMMVYINPIRGNTENIIAVMYPELLDGSSGRFGLGVLYVTHFEWLDMFDSMRYFHDRRRQAYNAGFGADYQEMDDIVAISWDEIKRAILSAQSDFGIFVSALRWDDFEEIFKTDIVPLRPAFVIQIREFLQDQRPNAGLFRLYSGYTAC